MGASRTGRLFPGLDGYRKQKKKLDEIPITFRATPKQIELMDVVTDGRYTIIGMGGGIRGTKTFGTVGTLITLCRVFPRSRWAIVRMDLPTLRRNILPSMEKLRVMSGGFVGPLNMSTWSYTCANGSEIILFAEQFTQDPNLDRWRGLEVNGFLLEEGNELSEKSAFKAIERAGAYIIPPTVEDPTPRQPPPLILVTFNPCIEWPRRWFYEPWKAGSIREPYYFLPATIEDNPYATEEYKKSLKNLPKEEYDRFVRGQWDFVDNPKQLIKSEWIWRARNVEPVSGLLRLGADVARYGDDFSTTATGHSLALYQIEEYKHKSTVDFSIIVMNTANERNVLPANVRVDGVGLGAGTVDYAHKQKFRLKDVISGAKPVHRPGSFFKFRNLRSQMWWEFREKLREGKFSIFLRDGHGREVTVPEKLVGDLAALEYEIDGDKMITVESKDDVKERLGRSTDYGDAVVMMAFDFPPEPRSTVLPGSSVVGEYA